MWICVGPRDPSTKPSRGWLRVVIRKPRLVLSEYRATRNKVTATPRSYWRGCKKMYLPLSVLKAAQWPLPREPQDLKSGVVDGEMRPPVLGGERF